MDRTYSVSRVRLLPCILAAMLVPGAGWSPQAAAGEATAPPPPAAGSLRRVRIAPLPPGGIRVDGRGDDAGWQDLPWAEGFVQNHPDEGRPASEPTRFKVGHDDHAIYLLLDALDSRPEQIHGLLTRRDEVSSSDWLVLTLDPQGSHRSGYRFYINPRGVKIDALVYADGVEDLSWDAVWDSAVASGPAGWLAELRIPFSQLRYEAGAASWGLQVSRLLSRRNETDHFNPQPKGTAYPLDHLGTLDGLAALPRAWQVELTPYAFAALQRQEGEGPADWSLGGDGRIGLGPVLTIDLTVNPDFGQVEADPSELNLNAYETFLTEKRPFFLQGSEIFQYSLGFGDMAYETLFYSRRIGRVPSRELELDDAQIEQLPRWTTILGAAKLTGKTAGGWSIGVLDALTGSEWADVRLDGQKARLPVEPLAHAVVARVTRDLRGGKTRIGGLATHLVRDLQGDAAGYFPEQAATGGLDVDHREGELSLIARLQGSHLRGSPAAITRLQRSSVHYFQRPDAPYLGYDEAADSLSGWGTTLVAGKLTGQPWRGAAGGWMRSPGFDPNDLGFMQFGNNQAAFGWAQYRQETPGAWHQSYQVNFNGWACRTFGPELVDLGGNVNGSWVLPGNEQLYGGVARSFEVLDVTALRGGPALLVPGSWGAWFGGGTDDRQRWRLYLDGSLTFGDEDSRWSVWAQLTASLRPTSALQLQLAPAWERSSLGHQFVATLENGSGAAGERELRHIVGLLERDTASLTLRASWTFTPELSLQLYLMPYLSAGTYRRFYEVTEPRGASYAARFTEIGNEAGWDERFRFTQLRSNLVARWEYLPGSTLFLVWSHEQGEKSEEFGSISPWRDGGDLLGSPASDVLMLKLAYWYAP